MTKIDIFSGFLGAGKTSLIKKLIKEAYNGEKLVLIENEFGEIGIDGGFMQEAGINVNEMNSGCICCSLVGDFAEALKKVIKEYNPDRILIEPSGVGKLSDVIKAVENARLNNVNLNSYCAVVDAKKCKMYMKNFGEFFNNQVESASCIILSHTDGLTEEKLGDTLSLIRNQNKSAQIITTPWDDISGITILSAIENANSLAHDIEKLEDEEVCPTCGHHHEHDHHHEEECHCDHHHDHEEECHCGHHHDHHHEEECHCDHHHDHHHEEECHCDHHHDHDHYHHADEVFTSWGKETIHKYTKEELESILASLSNEEKYGTILRTKGIVCSKNGEWIHFDYIPGEADVRSGSAGVIGRLCVIGSKINEVALAELFKI